MNLQRIVLIAFFFATTFSLSAQNAVPNITLKTMEGQSVNLLEEYGVEKDKITIFSFWATWCGPCIQELNAIMDYYEEWQELYDVELIAITVDANRSDLAKVNSTVAQKGWPYKILQGNAQEIYNVFNFYNPPQTLVIDKTGQIVYVHNGYKAGDELELEDVIVELSRK